MMKRCHWVKPVLVAQVKFTEWTHDDQLRQAVFLGLRNAVRALAFKWIRTLYARWKANQPYDESRYLQAFQSKTFSVTFS